MNERKVNNIRNLKVALLPLLFLLYGCSKHHQDYFPLGNHAWWEYTITRTVDSKQLTQKYVVATLPPREINGITVFPRKSASGSIELYTKSNNGIVRLRSLEDTGMQVLRYPLQVGTKWKGSSRISFLEIPGQNRAEIWATTGPVQLEYRIEAINETVEVPAGIFLHCVRIEGRGHLNTKRALKLFAGVRTIRVEHTDWYAPGTGLVKSVRQETASPNTINGNYTMELESFRL
ncbi:MAG: hypothetical protein ACE5GZ_01140 [Gammaproteobacteria bacterium]